MNYHKCSRKGCNYETTNSRIPKIGHLCDVCMAEFTFDFMIHDCSYPIGENKIIDSLDLFMTTSKLSAVGIIDVCNFFKRFKQ